MERKSYRWCVVPKCRNTSISTPNKIFIDVPRKADMRKKWMELARRQYDGMSVDSPIYFCEDHFDMPNDMENYMRYHVMDSVKKIIKKPGCLPSKFHCQTDKISLPSTSSSRPAVVERQRLALVQEALESNRKNRILSIDTDVRVKQQPKTQDKVLEKETQQVLNNMCKIIEAKPDLYIGLTKDCYFLVDLIHGHANIPTEHILLCLKKIRLNTLFSELADQFGITESYGEKIFLKNIPIISSLLRPFIAGLDTNKNKRCLPLYDKVSCIIDCFEIEIENPAKSLNQALTWSEHKTRHTIKYLISSTPNGLVNYISSGYGGQMSDTLLLETCQFLEQLEPGSWVLADRGFRHIEKLLIQKQCSLLRPPSVTQGAKLTKQNARIHERVIRRIQEFSMLKPHSVVNSNLNCVLDDCVLIACAFINLQGLVLSNETLMF